ncbi:unnamed protein product [Heterosigma akashiwo]
MGLHPQSTCLISMLLVSLQCVSSFMVYRGTLPPTFRPAQFEKQDERLLSSMLCSDRGLKTELWAQLSNSPEEGDAIFEGDFELKEMSARDASRNLENWIERHFQSQRDAGNDDPRGTYSDPIIILQQMQDWAIAARFRSTKTVKRVLFALDQEDVIQGISCTEVITKEGAGSAEFKVRFHSGN